MEVVSLRWIAGVTTTHSLSVCRSKNLEKSLSWFRAFPVSSALGRKANRTLRRFESGSTKACSSGLGEWIDCEVTGTKWLCQAASGYCQKPAAGTASRIKRDRSKQYAGGPRKA